MSVIRPFRRTFRPIADGSQGNWSYILHPKFAQSPEHFVRAFILLQKDLDTLSNYVEPAEDNLKCHSFRIHELLLRACIEVEANCKAILLENGYRKSDNLDMRDYKRINVSHHLSSYEINVPIWRGRGSLRKPFAAWANAGKLPWYDAYNQTKHDRHTEFKLASFENMLDAIAGLTVLLSAQFWNHDFGPASRLLSISGPDDGMESAIGDFFRIKFPTDWTSDERYQFDWNQIKDESDPFQNFNFEAVVMPSTPAQSA
jgi:hypothetical protein